MNQTSRLSIEIDSRNAEQKAVDVQKALEALEDAGLSIKPAMEKAGAGMESMGKSADGAAKSVSAGASGIESSSKKTTAAIKEQVSASDAATKSFRDLYGGTSALEAGMFSLGNSIKNGSFISSLKATKEAEAWLESLNATTKESGKVFLETGQKFTHLSNGMKGLGAWNGTGSPVFESISRRSKQVSTGLSGVTTDLNKTGMSAKQTAAALRGVPAQFTDIAVSLQGGQAPLTVFLQQGGQLKDMFGGAVPAAKALGGYVLGLVNPFTVAAAAAGTLGLAYYQGSKEADAYRQALILTGNAAGTSAGALGSMAENVSRSVGTIGAASVVLAQLAGSSKIPASSFEMIATAALKMEDATGKAASKTVADFEKLAKDPVKASAELNDQLGYLTASTYAQIEALAKQGDQQGAGNLAEKAYAEAVSSRADTIKSKLGLVESAWDGVKSAAKGAWDAVLDIGREDTFEQKLVKLEDRLNRVRNAKTPTIFDDNPNLGELGAGESGAQSAITDLYVQKAEDDRRAAAKAELLRLDKESIANQGKLSEALKNSASNAEKLKARYAEIDEQVKSASRRGQSYSDDQIKQLKDAAAKQYADPQAAKPKAYTEDAGTKMLDAARQTNAVLTQQLASVNGQGIAVQRIGAQAQALVKWEQQLADIKSKQTLTADQKSLLANQDLITAQLKRNAALEREAEIQKGIKQANEDQVKLLTMTGQLREANQLKSSLEDAAQLAEYERQGNVEAAKRLETLIKIRDINLKAAQKPGTVEGVSKAPTTTGIDASVGGAYSEIDRLNDQQAALDAWRATELEKQRAYLDLKAINEETYAERVENIDRQAQAGREQIEKAKNAAIMSASADFFGNMAVLSRSGNSRLGAIGKAAAIAQTTISTYKSATDSYAALAAIPIVGPALGFAAAAAAITAGLANVAAINGVGFSTGGYTGPGGVNDPAGIVHKGEVVWSQADIRRFGGVAAVEGLRTGNVTPITSARMAGGSQGQAGAASATGIQQNINIHNYTNSQVETRQRSNGDIDVIVKAAVEEVAGQFASGYGHVVDAYEGAYGARRSGG
ncbi:phage tail length tape measure family protein [Pseudomonas sp. NPDC089392]|uniref:phage tail length tape measure family protein n=1 Tax=Pseudomonas sp. NPDC089392 TaxID=3364459 RepID=UPI003805876B